MNFSDLSPADAERYRACIEADGPIRLAQLAKLLRIDGVNVQQFDASLESLVPLWEWFVGFAAANFPGIPSRAEARLNAVHKLTPEANKRVYVSELIMHYLFEVTKGLFNEVAWVVDSRRTNATYQQTMRQFVDDSGTRDWAELDLFSDSSVLSLVNRREGVDASDWLLNRALAYSLRGGASTMERILAAPRSGVSILEGLGNPGPALPPLVFPSSSEATLSLDDDEDDLIGDELMLAHAKANPEDVSRAKPLDVVAVAEALKLLGCRTMNGEPVTVEGILAAEYEEYLRADEAAMFATESYRGKLRAVHVDAIEPSREQWDEIMTVLQELAVKLGARLARSEEFYPAGSE